MGDFSDAMEVSQSASAGIHQAPGEVSECPSEGIYRAPRGEVKEFIGCQERFGRDRVWECIGLRRQP